VTDTDGQSQHGTAYEQVCTSFHAIDDFRTKLLGFLPLVTGGGLILLTGRPDEVRERFFAPLGLFGFLVTFGLLIYELNGMKRCLELIYDGEALEDCMELERGQFITRANARRNTFTKPFAAAWIYPAVLAAWTYLALYERHGLAKVISASLVFILGLVGVTRYDQSLRKNLKHNLEKDLEQRESERRAKASRTVNDGERSAK
jgi:hypothetical protein